MDIVKLENDLNKTVTSTSHKHFIFHTLIACAHNTRDYKTCIEIYMTCFASVSICTILGSVFLMFLAHIQIGKGYVCEVFMRRKNCTRERS